MNDNHLRASDVEHIYVEAEPLDDGESAVPQKSAVDYAKAVENFAAVAEVAVRFVPRKFGGAVAVKAVKAAIPVAHMVAKEAPDLVNAAAPAVAKAAAKAPEAAAKAKEGIGKAGHAFGEGAVHAAQAVGHGIGKAAAAAGSGAKAAAQSVGSKAKQATEDKQRERAQKEARKVVTESSSMQLSVKEFFSQRAAHNSAFGAKADYLDYPGCFAILLMPKNAKKGDFTAYNQVFVGGSEHLGQALYDQLTGKGNPDVYADVKYQQKVYILLYPCGVDQIGELEEQLICALDADVSYNAAKA